jgi:propionyl-CoA carboxylase alpha chain
LDEYVIEGVQHNAKLCQAVLRNKAFQDGHTPTNFLPFHFPDGFKGVELTEAETQEFVIAAAIIGQARQEYLDLPPLTGGSLKDTADVSIAPGAIIVRMGGLFGTAYSVAFSDDKKSAIVQELDGMAATGAPKTVSIDEAMKYEPLRYSAIVSLDGEARPLQVLPADESDIAGAMKLQMYGAVSNVILQTPREYELSSYLKEPIKADTSSQILSPMPGTLISFAVKPGDEVEDGQELCVIESMKMQNMIRSPKKGVIASCKVEAGATLKVDQTIIEFVVPIPED